MKLLKDTFKIARRSDLIGEYLGHTAVKTQKVIDSCMGGVLFIDEAYSLGSDNRRHDSFSKECVDTLNQNLSERKGQFICIIAGYRDELEKNFFVLNPGLKRRFSFKYSIDKYSWEELSRILIHKVHKIGWFLNKETRDWILESKFLENRMEYFPHFGGDIETWLLQVKIIHGRRVFGSHPALHKVITQKDLEEGFKRFIQHRKKDDSNKPPPNFYV